MMTSNGHINFRKSAKVRVTNEFPSKSDVAEVLTFVREQKVPGELVISLPGNGGISGIVFREKESEMAAEIPEMGER